MDAKLSAYQKAWRLRNREKVRAWAARWRRNNKERASKKAKEWVVNNRDRVRAAHVRRRYGLTPEQYAALLHKQGHACAGCRRSFEDGVMQTVDHCHSTGCVRGILCPSCNRAIGLAVDDPVILRRLASYLTRTG